MGKRENKVEVYLHEQIKLKGGNTWKMIGTAGLPDRLCCLPGIGLFAVEVKTHDGKLSTRQARTRADILNAGGQSLVVYGKKEVDRLVDRFTNA